MTTDTSPATDSTHRDAAHPQDLRPGRPVVFRHATVLTVDSHGVIENGDVLVIGDRIEAIGRDLTVPEGTVEVDATGGILMPGMIDSHRHMYQTALRGIGADWTLSQYFVFCYLNWGRLFRPQDVYAGNLLAAVEALDAGVTTTLDWSHGLQTLDHADAAVDALQATPGRFVLAYGNLLGAPWEWATSADFKAFANRRFTPGNDMLGLQLAFDVTADPSFPERKAFEVARDLGLRVTTHAGVWGATTDDSIRLMWENGFMTPDVTYVHATSLSPDSYHRIAATGGSVSVSSESELNAGQGYPPTWQLRKHDIPVSLSMDSSMWWSADLFSAMRSTLSSDRAREHLAAHSRDETIVHNHLRAEDVVRWATLGGAQALGLDSVIGSITPGKKADLVLIKNDRSPAMHPIIHPYGHVVFQAGRGDVHTVMVNGKIVKYDHALLHDTLTTARTATAETVEHFRTTMGEKEWQAAREPELPHSERISNPYSYTSWDGGDDRHQPEV
ncbi:MULTISPECIES: amidohydrolase family protein [unclassified Streptomyces]|uniref:amidohydrolase family protein n=1 Tax=unclassified Streptomyces TaxID=2593676 RepID=UPI0029BE7D5F|nr:MULTISPECIES: amidohydrolase family protein [unclassified Streptomyces]MDX3771776.1 amidohydrolase family protein [Streptomyces sp. AK08-01B]MDX3821328.1 amidohydrolase family protein [Streptomyces sp. AK08-01A]